MSSLFLAEIEIFDFDKYREYIDRASQIVQRYDGEHGFRSEHIVLMSGNCTPHRLVLIRFNTKADVLMCFGSEEYHQIKHLREQSTKSRAAIIDQEADANR